MMISRDGSEISSGLWSSVAKHINSASSLSNVVSGSWSVTSAVGDALQLPELDCWSSCAPFRRARIRSHRFLRPLYSSICITDRLKRWNLLYRIPVQAHCTRRSIFPIYLLRYELPRCRWCWHLVPVRIFCYGLFWTTIFGGWPASESLELASACDSGQLHVS